MTNSNTGTTVLRIVDGGAATRPSARPGAHLSARPIPATQTRRVMAPWLDWAPMLLLGLSAGLAGVWQVVAAVTH